jgi:RNA polymerase sigma-70 factor, ECF subfamily
VAWRCARSSSRRTEQEPVIERDPDPALARVFRDEWGRVLASLVGYLRDFDLAEDVVQHAFATAAERWRHDGVPDNPAGWLVRTARNEAIDRLRRRRTLEAKLPLLDRPLEVAPPVDHELERHLSGHSIPDERLELLFTCCHPALAQDAQVALTLRAVGGLSTDEIAAAFLVAPETMKRRLTRAKQKITAAGIPFRVPPDHLLPDRLAVVLAVVYLVFNQGYSGRVDLATEAIRLGRVLVALMPDESEVRGLLALMLAHDARRAARVDGDELVLLQDQDRSLWDARQLEEARQLLARAIAGRGPYALQAAIAVLHTDDPVDWPQIAALYAELAERTGSPVVELNRAVALAQTGATERALELTDGLAAELDGYPYLHSTRAELLRRLGRYDEARGAYGRAVELSAEDRERRFLLGRLADLENP